MDAKKALKRKDKILPDLREGETVLARTIISNAIFWKGIAVIFIAIIFLLVGWQLTVFLLLVALIILGFAYVKKSFLLLVVTNQRVLLKSGLLMTDMVQLQYSKIESVETQTNLLGRFLGYSTIMVSGTGSILAYIPFVANAGGIRDAINELLQERDVSGREHMEIQAKIQAQALADAIEKPHDDTIII